jgi:putative redox protein
MSVLTASAQLVGGQMRNDVDVNGRHTIVTDEPASLGGTDTGPAPHELLAAMLASCASTMIALYAQRHGWELAYVRVDVSYDTDTTPRTIRMAIQLPEGLSEDQINRLRKVADACPAKRALVAGFTFGQEVILGSDPTSARNASRRNGERLSAVAD